MSEKLLVRHCSPTLAALKTGNLFNCRYESIGVLKRKINDMNKKLNPKGVYICLLRLKNNNALIYVFRPEKLKFDLSKEDALIMLKEAGYKGESLSDYIEHLSERIICCSEFPHEIGLFLGYPIEDIKGFIKNKGKNCICTGCWKVYCNVGDALRTFEKFKKCTEIYCRKLDEGLSIIRLTIAV